MMSMKREMKKSVATAHVAGQPTQRHADDHGDRHDGDANED